MFNANDTTLTILEKKLTNWSLKLTKRLAHDYNTKGLLINRVLIFLLVCSMYSSPQLLHLIL